MPAQPKQRPRPPAAKKAPAAKTAPDPDNGAHEIVSLASEAAQAGLASMPRAAAPLTADPAPATLREANITDEAKDMGPVFGDFLKSVGLAVAETQEKLDETFRKTAEALSKQEINVVAVFEQELDDNGKMKEGKPITMALPLITYVMPTIQEISRCEISADMKVREFSSGNGFQIQGKSQSLSTGVSGSYGMFGGSVSGHFSYGQSSAEASGGSNHATDEAAGNMHLEATIQPRENVQLPKPFVTQKGPSLKLTIDKVESLFVDVPPATDGGAVTKRRNGTKATITAELTATNGALLKGKKLEVSVDQPTVGRTIANSTTDDKGIVTIELERVAADEDWKPLETTVRVWLGLVSQAVVLGV
jgi:hypothetical protein